MTDSHDNGAPPVRRPRKPSGTYRAQAAWRERNPLKVWAHASLRSGLKRGLVQQQPCEVCGDPNSEAHHDDHSAPLKVRWLCRQHHKTLHALKVKA